MENENKQIVEQPHSVKFAINAKGQLSAEVKAYAATPEEAYDRAKGLLDKAESLIAEKNGLNQ